LEIDMALPEASELTKLFEYLDALRESAVTNMFGARPFLIRETTVDPANAGNVLSAWMKTFDGSAVDVRVDKALAEEPSA
jgi:hypothetical protein